MATVESLAKKYGVPEKKIVDLCAKHGTRVFGNNWPLTNELTAQIEKEIRPVPIPQEELLSRNYIIFTLTAMEKPGLQLVLQQILELRMNKRTNSKLVAVSAAIDQLEVDAKAEAANVGNPRGRFLMENARLFDEMRSRGWLNILQGGIAEEGLVLGNYIRLKCKASDSVLVLGKNMSLNTCVHLRNKANQHEGPDKKPVDNKGYISVEERGISSKGWLQSINNTPVFGPIGRERYFRIDKRKYSVSVQETQIPDDLMQLRGSIPGAGEVVYRFIGKEWKTMRLGEKFNEGAEGFIYLLEDRDVCAKIFRPENLRMRKLEKLRILCDNYERLRGRDNSVIRRLGWPQEVLFNEKKEPIGYIMRFFRNVRSFDRISSRTYSGYIQNNKEKQIIAAVSLVELVRFLHDNNIILCDINRGNVLFDDSQRAYLVDLDSAQITNPKPERIEGDTAHFACYPANVAVPQFLPPERVNAKNYSFVHTKADDVWILQYMIFLLLTSCGAYFPYEHAAETKEGKQDVLHGNYQFHFNYTRPVATDDPLYSMHCMISYLAPDVQKAFFNSFSGKGTKFKAVNRYEARIWMLHLVKYYYDLPNMKKKDPEYGVYRPSKIKLYENRTNAAINFNELADFLDNFDSWKLR